jgi:predicted nuclease of predicted toxin-antitoxin system
VKFLVDAQLPRRLADWLNLRGHDAIHTLELPQKNRTADGDLLLLADQEQRVLISKDTDFAISRELGKGPSMLLLVSAGNVHNDELRRSSRGTRPPSANSWRSILFLS